MSKVEISGRGRQLTLKVDGRQLDAQGFVLYGSVRDVPMLEVELPVLEPAIGMDPVRVHLTSATRDVLIAMGWTPPEED